ncbi:MAG: NAD(P)-dependent oxidoreductase [Candidatus Omnitrophota bacterium]
MRIIVTGGAGNIGHHLCRHLVQNGHYVTSIDIQECQEPGVCSKIANLLEPTNLPEIMKGHDLVVHLANWPTARNVGDQRVLSENTLMTFNVFNAVASAGVGRVIHCSSESAMGFGHMPKGYKPIPKYFPIDEEHPCTPNEAYSYSKLFGEIMAKGFNRQYGIKFIVLRYQWVMTDRGLEGFKQTVMPLIQQGRAEQDPRLLFSPYLSVDDFCEAVAAFALHDEVEYEIFLVCGPTTYFSKPTLDIIYERYGQDVIIRKPYIYEKEPYASFFDCSKMQEVVGFSPRRRWE